MLCANNSAAQPANRSIGKNVANVDPKFIAMLLYGYVGGSIAVTRRKCMPATTTTAYTILLSISMRAQIIVGRIAHCILFERRGKKSLHLKYISPSRPSCARITCVPEAVT